MRSYSLFSKTDKTPRERFFNPADGSADEGLSGSSSQDGAQGYRYRELRFNPRNPEEELQELLLKLFQGKDVEKALLKFIDKNRQLVNLPLRNGKNILENLLEKGFNNLAGVLHNQFKARVQPDNLSLYLNQLFELDRELYLELKRNTFQPPRLTRTS